MTNVAVSRPTAFGLLTNQADARVLLTACLLGKLWHMPRPIAKGERESLVKSGAIFVWENLSSGITFWDDGLDWTNEDDEDNLESVCREVDSVNPKTPKEGGLIRKTTKLRYQGTWHNIVAYTKEENVKQGRLKRISDQAMLKDIEIYPGLARENQKYGCSAAGCFEGFDDKLEWRNHELSEHPEYLSTEMWRCLQHTGHYECAKQFANENTFKRHLQTDHGLADDRLPKAAEDGHIHHRRIWCGFCSTVVLLKAQGDGMERLDHIDVHYMRNEMWWDWIDVSGNLSKGALFQIGQKYAQFLEYLKLNKLIALDCKHTRTKCRRKTPWIKLDLFRLFCKKTRCPICIGNNSMATIKC